MPLYAFQCPKCGTYKEVIQSYSAGAPHCPKCETIMDKQVAPPGGFVFKGSGFYQTDFKNKK